MTYRYEVNSGACCLLPSGLSFDESINAYYENEHGYRLMVTRTMDGKMSLTHLTRDLNLKYGKGYGKSNLIYMRKLYRAFPKGMTVSYQLSWSHYLEILKCSDELEIGFYCAECARSNWNVRELRRQMKSSNQSARRRLNGGNTARARRRKICDNCDASNGEGFGIICA